MRSIVKWILVTTLITLLVPYRAGAQGLGDIKLYSYLNQPLNARVSIPAAPPGELDEARIGLASTKDFEKAGIKRRAVLDLIQFKLVKDKNGKPFIKLTTQDPINEPFLDFILAVIRPKGRLMREYTVLLDPPVTAQKAVLPKKSPLAGASVEKASGGHAAVQREIAGAAPSAVIATRSIEPKLTHDGYGPTMRPNTLWTIAKALRPDASMSVQQVMLAVVRNNPEAFYNNNVNELKAGYILRIPDKASINQVSGAAAAREVMLEYHRWIQSKKGKPPVAAGVQKSSPASGRATPNPARTATAADAAQGGQGPTEQGAASTTAAPSDVPNNLAQVNGR